MDIKTIVDCLRDNGIACPKEFANVQKDGCIKEYQKQLDDNILLIDGYVRFGINNGFSKSLQENIEKLVRLTVKICQEKNAKKADKMEGERAKITKEVEKIMKKGTDTINVMTELEKHINACISGSKALLASNMAEERKNVLTESIEKFNELKAVLSEVTDVSTTTAYEYAKEILAKVDAWSKKTAIMMHDQDSLALIDQAKASANEWKGVHVAVVNGGLFKKSNKVTDLSEIKFVPNDMYMIGKSVKVMENISNFGTNLAEYKDAVKNGRFGTEADEKEAEEKKELIRQLKEDKKELIAKFSAGEIDKHDLYIECKDIDEEVAEVESELKEIRETIENNRKAFRVYNTTFRKLERLYKVIMSYKAEPVMLSYLGEYVDFEKISRVMHGTGTAQDIASVVELKVTNADMNKIAQGRMREFVEALRESEKDEKEAFAQEIHVMTEEEKLAAEKAKKEEEEYLKKLLGEQAVASETVVSREEENMQALFGDEE